MNSLKRLVQHLTVKYWTLGRCPRDYSRDCPVGFTFGDNGYCNPNSSECGSQPTQCTSARVGHSDQKL